MQNRKGKIFAKIITNFHIKQPKDMLGSFFGIVLRNNNFLFEVINFMA